MKYYLPSTARQWLQQGRSQTDNFHLLLNRYLEFEEAARPEENGKFAKLELDGLHETFRFDKQKIPFGTLCEKERKTVEALHGSSCAATFHYRTTECLLLGAASVLENSLRLHHIWGFPYIPASSIKGLVRSFVIESLFDEDESLALRCPTFRQLFGSSGEAAPQLKDSKGIVAFYDALPLNPPRLKMDIMNPHYQEYFGGSAPPADYLSPVPIFFLTIDKGNTFQFCLGAAAVTPLPEKSKIVQQAGSRQSLDIAAYFLEEALKENGIGGKTSVGYGFMEKNNKK